MSNGYQLELLEFLAQGERSVDALAQVSGLTVANTSQHLQQLRQAGLVANRKEGHKVYSAFDNLLCPGRPGHWHCATTSQARCRSVASSRNDWTPCSDAYFASPLAQGTPGKQCGLTATGVYQPSLCSPWLAAREGLVTVLDVRPPEEYTSGYLAGAINIPLSELEKHLDELDPDHEIVAYCRGTHCVLAFDAVSRLREKGITARRLDGGLPEWRLEGCLWRLLEHAVNALLAK